jgi:hypothetical protein
MSSIHLHAENMRVTVLVTFAKQHSSIDRLADRYHHQKTGDMNVKKGTEAKSPHRLWAELRYAAVGWSIKQHFFLFSKAVFDALSSIALPHFNSLNSLVSRTVLRESGLTKGAQL